MATLPDDFFTFATFGTLAGASGITAVVTASLNKTFGWSPAKTGLAVALVVTFAGLFLADKLGDVKADVVGFFNSFLVYLTAAGISDAAGSPRFRGPGAPSLFRSWFH
jgi:hypothetical protein